MAHKLKIAQAFTLITREFPQDVTATTHMPIIPDEFASRVEKIAPDLIEFAGRVLSTELKPVTVPESAHAVVILQGFMGALYQFNHSVAIGSLTSLVANAMKVIHQSSDQSSADNMMTAVAVLSIVSKSADFSSIVKDTGLSHDDLSALVQFDIRSTDAILRGHIGHIFTDNKWTAAGNLCMCLLASLTPEFLIQLADSVVSAILVSSKQASISVFGFAQLILPHLNSSHESHLLEIAHATWNVIMESWHESNVSFWSVDPILIIYGYYNINTGRYLTLLLECCIISQ